jgi:uncharacterized protein
MKLVSTHVDGSSHRLWTCVFTTPEPWCFYIPPYAPVVEAGGKQWSSPYPVIGLFWPDRFYQVFLLLQDNQTAYYCNVIQPPTYTAGAGDVTFVDLDLDVYVDAQKTSVLDEEEFTERRVGYSQTVIRNAARAVQELERFAKAKHGPFALATADRWRVWARMQEKT